MSVNSHLYRRDDPVTSKRAAEKAKLFKCSHEAAILTALHCRPVIGATYKEIADVLSMEPVAVARRLKGMERKGLVKRKSDGQMPRYRGGWRDAYAERDGCAIWWATSSSANTASR